MKRKFISRSLADTVKAGGSIARMLKKNDVVYVIGPLGAGKTALVKAICRHLGVKGIVNSPSFKLVNEYEGRMQIFHADLYRLGSYEDIASIGIEDYFNRGGITFVEWAEKLDPAAAPASARKITIEVKSDFGRIIEFRGK
jgi:tRNA threonylcarbamoyladenosine biosynthesis protein TsaE